MTYAAIALILILLTGAFRLRAKLNRQEAARLRAAIEQAEHDALAAKYYCFMSDEEREELHRSNWR